MGHPVIRPIEGNLNEFLALHMRLFQDNSADARQEFKPFFSETRAVLTGAYDGRMVGYCMAREASNFRREPCVGTMPPGPLDETVFIRYIALDFDYRGRGLSPEMIKHSLHQARQKGFHYVSGLFKEGASASAALKIITPTMPVIDIPEYDEEHSYQYIAGKIE